MEELNRKKTLSLGVADDPRRTVNLAPSADGDESDDGDNDNQSLSHSQLMTEDSSTARRSRSSTSLDASRRTRRAKRPSTLAARGMRQHDLLRLAQSERNLRLSTRDDNNNDNDDDNRSLASVRSGRNNLSRTTGRMARLSNSVRRITSTTTTTTTTDSSSEDTMLLLELTKKVRQLEAEKSKLQHDHEEQLSVVQQQLDQLRLEKKKTANNNSASTDSQQQQQLQKAVARIAELEQRLAAAGSGNATGPSSPFSSPTKLDRLRAFGQRWAPGAGGTAGTTTSTSAATNEVVQVEETDRADKEEALPETQVSVASSNTGDADNNGDDHRNEKLEKLKAFRRSRESQLKELVLDSQSSPTDVQTVISNLQDELKAARAVMDQQRHQLETLMETANKEQPPTHAESPESTDTSGRVSVTIPSFTTSSSLSLEARYEDLARRHVQLELDRSWGEFQLRNRISADALKYHRRLRHWKEQSIELKEQLESNMEQNAEEARALRSGLLEAKQAAELAEQDLQEFKSGTAETLQELTRAQDRIVSLERELQKHRPAEAEGEDQGQGVFLQRAMDQRKQQEEKSASTRLSNRVRVALHLQPSGAAASPVHN